MKTSYIPCTLLLILACLLLSCTKGTADEAASSAGSSATTVAGSTTGQDSTTAPADIPAGQESDTPLASSGEEQPRHLGYCVEYCSRCGDHRGKNTAPPRDEPVRIDFNFMAVHYNPSAEADMSTLEFELVGQWRNRERMKTHLSMASREQDRFPLVDVGLCRLQVEPLLSNVVETAIRKRGANDYKTYGAYQVTVTDPEGALVGEFPLDGKGDPGEAQWQNTKESKYHVGKAYRRDTDQWRFDIRRMAEFREKKYEAPVLFGLIFHNDGKIRQKDYAPDNALHEYQFPAAGVDIYTPEAIRAAGLAALEAQKAEREVEYYVAMDEPQLSPSFISRGSIGGGSASPPSYGCGGGG
jgi:hypothetical protein